MLTFPLTTGARCKCGKLLLIAHELPDLYIYHLSIAMFDWLKPKVVLPPLSPANPGAGTWFRVGFCDAQRSWEEEADSLDILVAVLKARGIKFRKGKTHLELDSGLIVRPQFVRLQPRDDGHVLTITTVEINHPQWVPDGAFEYQHSIAPTMSEAMHKGFVGWVDVDLPVLEDALRDEPQSCTGMVADTANSAASVPRRRQIIFGPPVHCVTREAREAGQAHDFCPCCLFTNCFEAFREQVYGDRFYGIRLFASRDADGVIQADCRVNGVDWSPGADALRRYVTTWPERGFEYRKQYVAIRDRSLD